MPLLYILTAYQIKTMIEDYEINHRGGITKKGILALFGSIKKEQAYKDFAELKSLEGRRCAILSESSLKKDWLKPEEDEAWWEL
ncbi:Uncharacterised protein [uncultured archaeon]|nr:Uncharacterised protein [uncultured archaeon]